MQEINIKKRRRKQRDVFKSIERWEGDMANGKAKTLEEKETDSATFRNDACSNV